MRTDLTIRWAVSGLGLAVILLSSACTPTCRETCKKLLACEDLDSERVALDACDDSCGDLDAQYEDWEDESLIEALDEHKKCVGSSTCEEIGAGVCFDEALFVF